MIVGEKLPKNVRTWLWNNAFNFPNVVGYSIKYQKWFAGNNQYPVPVVRFYVNKKVSLSSLLPEEIIPKTLKIRNVVRKKAYQTDIIEIGELCANPPIPNDVRTSEVDKTQNFRPVELGVSIGNQAITAGSLGMLYEGVNGMMYCGGTNAHVGTPDAGMTVDEVVKSGKINILQRGVYHGGRIPQEVVGTYLWHKQVFGDKQEQSTCPIANFAALSLNALAWLFRRGSRLIAVGEIPTNTIDFMLYKPVTEHRLKIADNSINPHNTFIGHLFASGSTFGVICKISNIIKECPYPIKPLNGKWGDVAIGDKVKGCSFWCNFETEVIDTDAVVNVNYGDFTALMEDQILVRNDGTIKGGWSGSGWFKVE